MVLFENEVTQWSEMLMEAWCSGGDSLVGLTIPRPPSLAGKARSNSAHDPCHLEEPS